MRTQPEIHLDVGPDIDVSPVNKRYEYRHDDSTRRPSCGSAPADAAVAFHPVLRPVSLFADMVYEGARSIIGPYLATLGASAVIVGVAAGAGEFIGYGLRVVSGANYWVLAQIS